MKYPAENWQALGRYVKRKRPLVEPDMTLWAAKVGRSSRVLLGLERGEQQGMNTVVLVAGALGVDPEELTRILSSSPGDAGQRPPAIKDHTYTGDAELVREHVVQWYLAAPIADRDHAIDLLIQFLREHPHGGVTGS